MPHRTFNTGDIPTAGDFNRFMQVERDTAANWTAANPILGSGDFGYETDTFKLKLGDGVTAWNSLPYRSGGDVVGPASAVAGHLAVFSGTTGKLIADGGVAPTGTNTGDETTATIKSKLGITTLSGSNTGDQTSVTGNAGTATALQTARTIGGVSFDGTANITQPYDIPAFYPGVPTASAKLLRFTLARAVTFAANFSGSQFTATANATGSTVFDIQKNGSSVGSCTIAAGGTTPTFATSGGAAVSFAAGDVLAIIAPGTADATLADPAITLVGAR